ncbi:hypothetical protein [Sphingobium boeckii]|uniref:Uncharacterized protein n=1 Tax=Sphingobium boeckii TaxID=1082345 RepID=A0A7W9AF66_9SPHN|nr:hypothetical protein [Sphingobium boeckii]MBB5684524.1 hypothetical protein [Sphingobium boeckii]
MIVIPFHHVVYFDGCRGMHAAGFQHFDGRALRFFPSTTIEHGSTQNSGARTV